MKLFSLHIYPIKSLKGIDLDSVSVTSKGPHLDRRVMAVDRNGRFLSQRQHPRMALITVSVEHNLLHLFAHELPALTLSLPADGEEREVSVWDDRVKALDLGQDAADWLSAYLKISCRLVYLPDRFIRPVSSKYATDPADEVSFADGYPFLLISQASLEDLNNRLNNPLSMNRFRPNLVLSGCRPYEEDQWKKIRIGKIVFQAVKPCARCVITTTDQETAERGVEPLKTLASYRKGEKGILFGQNLIHKNLGTLHVGDQVEVIEFKS